MSNEGNQPLRSKFLLILGSSSSKTTFLSPTQIEEGSTSHKSLDFSHSETSHY